MGHAKQKSLIFCSVQSSAQDEKSAIGFRISGSMQNGKKVYEKIQRCLWTNRKISDKIYQKDFSTGKPQNENIKKASF